MDGFRGKLYFIYNPRSGKEKIKGRLYGILDELSSADYELTVYPTRRVHDAYERIAALPDDYELVVAAGGDGTLEEVAAGMMRRGRKVPIGYIPAGSTNDFAKSLKIPSNMRKAAALAVRGTAYSIDVGMIGTRNFVYCAAFGLFTEVSYNTSQAEKNLLGHMAYVLEGAKSLADIKSYHMRVAADKVCFEGNFIYGMVTNSKSVGGFKRIVGKNVVFDDGLFEVMFIEMPRNLTELNKIVASLSTGRIDTKHIYSFKSSRVCVDAECPVPWATDGESGGVYTHVEISNCRKAVEINISPREREILTAEGCAAQKP